MIIAHVEALQVVQRRYKWIPKEQLVINTGSKTFLSVKDAAEGFQRIERGFQRHGMQLMPELVPEAGRPERKRKKPRLGLSFCSGGFKYERRILDVRFRCSIWCWPDGLPTSKVQCDASVAWGQHKMCGPDKQIKFSV